MRPEAPQHTGRKSFWDTTVGIITKVTVVISAVTGLIIAFNNFNSAVHSGDRNQPSVNTPPGRSENSAQPAQPEAGGGKEEAAPVDPGYTTPVEEKPDVSISAFSVSPPEITLDEDAKPKPFTASLEAFNNGNRLAENCVFTLTSDGGELGNPSSESFSLDPQAKRQVTVNATISKSGKITARLSCSNDTEKTSATTGITVFNYGTIHHVSPRE